MIGADLLDFELPVGRVDREPETDAVACGGSAGALHFEIEWDASLPRDAVGSLRMHLGQSLVWGAPDQGIRADLAPLLVFLAKHWDALVLEQGYPRGVTPMAPSMARRAYVRLVQDTYSDVRPDTDDLK